MLLGELFSVSAAHQRSMQVAGRGQAQGLLQQYLARRIVGEIFAPNHMRDALGAVVHHHGQLVGPQAIGAAENEVTDAVHDILLLSAQATIMPGQGIGCYRKHSFLRFMDGRQSHFFIYFVVAKRQARAGFPCSPARQVPG